MSLPGGERDTVFITNRAHPEVVEFLAQYAHVDVNPSIEPFSKKQWMDHASRARAVMVFMNDTMDASTLAALPKLKIVAAALKGYDNFDVEACTARGIWFTIVPDLLTIPTAELAIALAMALSRKILEGDSHVRSGNFAGWRPSLYGTGLHGRTAGIVGMGKLGCAVAERLQPFGMHVIYSDPSLPPAGKAHNAEPVEFSRLVESSDFIFVLAPLSPDTKHMFDAAALARMKPGSFLINVGRGSVVNEAAVAEALRGGHLAGYAADVFELEDWARADRPLAICPELLAQSGKTLFTPHLGSADQKIRLEIEMRAARNIVDFLSGRRPADAINQPI